MNPDFNRNSYTDDFKNTYRDSSYYKAGQTWDDYQPAYAYGYDRYTTDLRGRSWNDAESELEAGWENAKAQSSLAWEDAKGAIREGWHKLERAMPGDADNDGR